jgi:hypothetical protein
MEEANESVLERVSNTSERLILARAKGIAKLKLYERHRHSG